MAEEKKKRGRPPKIKPEVNINEQAKSIRMTDQEKVKIKDVNNRMSALFSKMNSKMIPYQTFQEAINRNPLNFDGFLNNPFIQNQRIKQSNSAVHLSTKSQILEALSDPGQNEKSLRESSMALFYNNYVYQNLVRLNRDIPQFFYYTTPVGVDKETLKSDKFKHQNKFVNKFLQTFDVPQTFKTVSLQTAREGKCSYVFRDSFDMKKGIVDFALLQKLPSNYIKYTGFGSESPLIVSFDFRFFLNPLNSLSQWPEWFSQIWNQLMECGVVNINKNNGYEIKPLTRMPSTFPDHMFENINGMYYLYVELPQDIVYTFGSDLGDVFAIPEYAGLFSDLSELDAYKTLQQQTLLTNITNILTGEVPIEKEATAGTDAAILSPEVILGLEGDCSAALNSNIFPFFAPLTNFKMHSLEPIPAATEIVLSSVRDVISTAGTSGLINTNDKPSIAMIKGEQMLHESKMEYYVLQYSKFLNLIINKYLDLDFEFKITIWGGAYSWKDDVKTMKEMIQNGFIGIFPRLLSAYRMTIDDYKAQYDYVDSLEIFVKEEQTDKNKNSVGRPKLDDNDIENDNTAISIEQGGNVSENKV